MNHYTVQWAAYTIWNVAGALKARNKILSNALSKTWNICSLPDKKTIAVAKKLPGHDVTCRLIYTISRQKYAHTSSLNRRVHVSPTSMAPLAAGVLDSESTCNGLSSTWIIVQEIPLVKLMEEKNKIFDFISSTTWIQVDYTVCPRKKLSKFWRHVAQKVTRIWQYPLAEQNAIVFLTCAPNIRKIHWSLHKI